MGTKEYLLFRNKSSMHLFIWAIHSCFSVPVAAYTANDLVGVRISQPFRYSIYKKIQMINLWIIEIKSSKIKMIYWKKLNKTLNRTKTQDKSVEFNKKALTSIILESLQL